MRKVVCGPRVYARTLKRTIDLHSVLSNTYKDVVESAKGKSIKVMQEPMVLSRAGPMFLKGMNYRAGRMF